MLELLTKLDQVRHAARETRQAVNHDCVAALSLIQLGLQAWTRRLGAHAVVDDDCVYADGGEGASL